MMYKESFDGGYLLVRSGILGLHALGSLLLFIGIVFLIVWAVKHLKAADLKRWGWILVATGIVLCLLSLSGKFLGKRTTWDIKDMPMQSSMNGMHMEHGDISMSGMNKALEGKSGNEFDLMFIEMMIPHHQGAIDMALQAREHAEHQEIKDMAEDIIEAQQREIDMMREWQSDWR